ncbi:DUF4166 domain-containing protein [Jeotgalibacillus terrae]|uniref:DUF4166 domain-containing protein n=1 Tax=Jeotgalibacillus terrae TaxID=587735 RepID=A0ABW5ZDG0_9BACL|nr:DUF4166 domain-containing protein [Jeotgalibacillus terrae]MBM7579526.1 hypothetical protein [Jeotgalibacillus terrae]
MKSMFQKAMGEEFTKLHPQLQKKYALNSSSDYKVITKGTMHEIKGGSRLVRKVSHLGVKMNFAFPERGDEIPFYMENAGYRDRHGREAMSWRRSFTFPDAVRCFYDKMKEGEQPNTVDNFTDLWGIARLPLHLNATRTGGMLLTSRDMTLHIGNKYMKIPRILGVRATVLEEYNKRTEMFDVHIHIYQPLFGTILSYKGSVEMTFPHKNTGK